MRLHGHIDASGSDHWPANHTWYVVACIYSRDSHRWKQWKSYHQRRYKGRVHLTEMRMSDRLELYGHLLKECPWEYGTIFVVNLESLRQQFYCTDANKQKIVIALWSSLGVFACGHSEWAREHGYGQVTELTFNTMEQGSDAENAVSLYLKERFQMPCHWHSGGHPGIDLADALGWFIYRSLHQSEPYLTKLGPDLCSRMQLVYLDGKSNAVRLDSYADLLRLKTKHPNG